MAHRKLILIILSLFVVVVGQWAPPDISYAGPQLQTMTGSITGAVFFDTNMNGLRDPDENGIFGAIVSLRDAYDVEIASATTSDADGGRYGFTGLQPGRYTVQETDAPTFGSTSPNLMPVSIGSVTVGDVNFGDVLKLTVSGRAYEDRDNNKAYNYGDVPVANAQVRIYDDANRNGWVDFGEPRLGSATSDAAGHYAVRDIMPGYRVMMIFTEVNGAFGEPIALYLPAREISEAALGDSHPLRPAIEATLSGVVWADTDGDELVEAGEARLPGVQLELFAVSGDELPFRTVQTDSLGQYQIADLPVALPYELRPVGSTLPAGWIMSGNLQSLFFTLTAAGPNVQNIGYYDPFTAAPMRQSEWKKELRQAGVPRFTSAQVSSFIAVAEQNSAVFAELTGLRTALQQQIKPTYLGFAYKELAALWLNRASGRLLPGTPISLPGLTGAVTIAGAISDAESVLLAAPTEADCKRVRQLAEAINNGQGVGVGVQGIMQLSEATLNSTGIASDLQPGGAIIDLYLGAPIRLLRWSPGTLSPTANILQPQVQITTQTFYNGGVLKVTQRLADGREIVLGTATPTEWNKDKRSVYLFDIWYASTVAQLVSTEIRVYVVDPDRDFGPSEHVRIDAAELTFSY